MWKKKLLVIFFGISMQCSSAQSLALTQFQAVLQAAQLDYVAPLENAYRPIAVEPNEFHSYEYAIQSKSRDIEIRYSIKTFATIAAPKNELPHLKCLAIANTLADNKVDQAIAVHGIPKRELMEKYNADWGAIVYFQPKIQFSDKTHCKMLTLFADGKADVYIFFLFDEPSDELKHQMYTLRFASD
ncbi:MAG: hypothetical protein AB8G15_01015 [Saprospiraceae bacterium]